jgi:hypothetical protein
MSIYPVGVHEADRIRALAYPGLVGDYRLAGVADRRET